jgi:hypothetical protein
VKDQLTVGYAGTILFWCPQDGLLIAMDVWRAAGLRKLHEGYKDVVVGQKK